MKALEWSFYAQAIGNLVDSNSANLKVSMVVQRLDNGCLEVRVGLFRD